MRIGRYLVTRKAGSVIVSVPTKAISFPKIYHVALNLTFDMTLLDERCRCDKMRCHTKPLHDNGQPPPAHAGNGDFVFNIAQLPAARFIQQAHVKQLFQQQIFVGPPKRIGGI
jgi:hypothetical protein